MTEQHRAQIEFVEWDRGYLPGYKGYRQNPPEPIQGVGVKRRVRGRAMRSGGAGGEAPRVAPTP